MKGDASMEELYQAAIESIKRYKEDVEELTDFDSFMDAIEKEYQEGQG